MVAMGITATSFGPKYSSPGQQKMTQVRIERPAIRHRRPARLGIRLSVPYI